MKSTVFQQAGRAMSCLCGALLLSQISIAQTSVSNFPTEADEPIEAAEPLDDFVERSTIAEHRVLPHQPIREADVLWEKRIWRVVDVREKMNLPFAFPQDPLFEIFTAAAQNGDLTLFSPDDDSFRKSLTINELNGILVETDTIVKLDPVTFVESIQVVENVMNWENVKRFRIKEAWFFDKNTGTMNVRILGIAPLLNVLDSEGNFRYEKPLFWVHLPSARPVLARHRVFLPGENLASTMTWDDLFEMRYFASTIYKESNIYNRRIEDYLTGTDVLFEADKIKNEIFNFESDLWQR